MSTSTTPISGLKLRLRDRADMCKGHYCIGRVFERTRSGLEYWEFWSDHSQTFTSAGTVYIGREAAMAKLREVKAVLKSVRRGFATIRPAGHQIS